MQLIYKYSALILLLTFLQSCGIYKKTDAREFPPEPEKRVAKNIKKVEGSNYLKMRNKVGFLILQLQMNCGERV